MEQSILTSTKAILGLQEEYSAFDLDIITHINAAFSTLNQLGIGPDDAFYIEDSNVEWSELTLPRNELNLVKTYIFLKVRILFDPPTTSFMIKAVEDQIIQIEWRLGVFRDEALAEEAV